MVKKTIYSEPIIISSPLQVTAVRVKADWLPYDISICSIYVPPRRTPLREDHLSDIVAQLQRPFLICGDFNGHSGLWNNDRQTSNDNGKEIENFLCNHGEIFLLNNGDFTHINSSYGSFSSIDLTFVSASIAADITWKVHHDACSSDHYPIFISINNSALQPAPINPRCVWRFKKADWSKFKNEIHFHEHVKIEGDVNEIVSEINADILRAAKISIPLLNLSKVKRVMPWWNEEIQDALKARKVALKLYRRVRSLDNWIDYKRKKAKVKLLIKASKEDSWSDFVQKINEPISQGDMWKRISLVKGKRPYNPVSGLKNENDEVITDKEQIANMLALNYVKNSSNEMYSEQFRRRKILIEQNLHIPPNTEQCDYNKPFTMNELLATFPSCKSSAAGHDNVCYQMIIQLPFEALEKLLELFNYIWITGQFPDCWKIALITPVLKPNKDKLSAQNYRPISLLSCTNKIMEKIVNKRLTWVIDHKIALSNPFQSGNRRFRSTMDNLVCLENEVLTAFQNKEYVVALTLDIVKAYERVNKSVVLNKISKAGVGGPLYHYIENFLTDTKIIVKVNNVMSSCYTLDNSIRQGSSLSGNIFGISTSDFGMIIPRGVNYNMFVDDKTIYVRHKEMDVIQQKLQLTLDNISTWADSNGFMFSYEKTGAVIFTRNRVFNNPLLFFQNHRITFSDHVKWLGVYLDTKWTFKKHIEQTKIKSLKAINILKVLNNKTWGLSRACLLRLFYAFVRPIMDYGAVIYGSATQSSLSKLNTVYHTALRIISGAYRTSPIESLYAENGQPPLETRRKILLANYGTRVKCNPSNPVSLILTHAQLGRNINRANRPRTIKSRLEDLQIFDRISAQVIKRDEYIAPWELSVPEIIYLTSEKKENLSSVAVKNAFFQFKGENQNSLFCYTDGSKTAANSGCAYITESESQVFKLYNENSVFSSELLAIFMLLSHICNTRSRPEYIFRDSVFICTDSKSSLLALKNIMSPNHLVNNILVKINELKILNITVKFLWIPSHLGIAGNVQVDELAKNSQNAPLLSMMTSEDLKSAIKKKLLSEWHLHWKNNVINNKLRRIKEDTLLWKSSFDKDRRKEIVICRLRIGHSHLTHNFLLKREDPPLCEWCNVQLSIQHILLECRKFRASRNKWHLKDDISALLGDDHDEIYKCIMYLKEAKLFHKI
ncbi:hypothetical protein M8J77_004220 [Diaphorina citri]|nr:hypothetical protein M8J77_004220 [Diaphorina citri]